MAGSAQVVLHDADVIADETLVRGAQGSLYVGVFGATDIDTRHALANAHVAVWLESSDGDSRHDLATARTGQDGAATVRFTVPRSAPAGLYRLVVHTRSRYGESTTREHVRVAEATQVHIRTDRAMYRPGQVVRWRVIAVNRANAHPLAQAAVEVAIEDPRGTVVWRGQVNTDETGMAQGELPLGEDLLLGRHTLTAAVGHVTHKTHVDVRTYVLPPFTVGIEPAAKGPFAPGSTVRGHVVARYPHGEPVSGQVRLRARSSHATRELSAGALDEHGRLAFSLTMPGDVPGDARALTLLAEVTDGAGRERSAELALPLPSTDLEVAIIPEQSALRPGVEQHVTILTTDGQGSFAPAQLTLRHGTSTQRVSSQGAARVKLTPPADAKRLILEVTATSPHARATLTRAVRVGPHARRWIRPRQAVNTAGSEIELDGAWSDARPLTISLLRENAAMATIVARADRSGRLQARLPVPANVFGLATVRVTGARWSLASRDEITTHTEQVSVYIHPEPLDVTIAGATRHRPGQVARVDVNVRDRRGAPVAGAGLAASVVDERALLLGEPGPDLITSLRALDMEDATAAGLVFARLLEHTQGQRERVALRALVEALPVTAREPLVHLAAATRVRDELERLDRVHSAAYEALAAYPGPISVERGGAWEFALPLDRVLARAGLDREERLTPWQKPLDWAYVGKLVPEFTFAGMAPELTRMRMSLLVQQLQALEPRLAELRLTRGSLSMSLLAANLAAPRALERLAAKGSVSRHLLVDPWGMPVRLSRRHLPAATSSSTDLPNLQQEVYDLTSAGPDRRFDTEDDVVLHDVLRQEPVPSVRIGAGWGTGSGYGGMRGRSGFTSGVRGAPDSVVAVRRRFDETVLWAAGLRTDAAGKITLEVPLADSITGWRVEVEALGPRGAMGTARARLETALPVHLDAILPDHLTHGDRYQLPVVIGNHGQEALALEIQAQVSGSLALLPGFQPPRVTVPAGATRAIAVPVEARAIGSAQIQLTLAHQGGRALDALERTLEVEARGHVVRAVHTGKAHGGGIRVPFTVPAAHAEGTMRGALRLYRDAIDQAVDGLESLVSEPYGCFEQTSSATYPNLLVLRLIGADPAQAALRQRALAFVARGYQRLISYEVSGGGFSWFGEAPANRVLTAYGLTQFADMAAVYPVDSALIQRTRDWLIGQQREDGSWPPDESWLHDWSAAQGQLATTAYIAWALAESGHTGPALERALAFLGRHRDELARAPYLLALLAATEAASGAGAGSWLRLLERRAAHENEGLRFPAGGETLFAVRGSAADVQVTALAALSLARLSRHKEAGEAMRWLWSARQPAQGWGSTQGTVLALRAAAAVAAAPASGEVRVRLGNTVLGTVDLDDRSADVPALPLPASLPPGRHEISIEGVHAPLDPAALRTDLRLAWRTREPAAESAGLRVRLRASQVPVRVGQHVDMRIDLRNSRDQAVAMPTVVVPVPPGFRADPVSLDALRGQAGVDKVEDLGAVIHVYLSRLDGDARVTLPYRLEATAAAEVTQRGVQAYAYYAPEIRGTSAPLRLRALPRP